MTTNRQIEAAIFKKTGIAGVRVFKAGGLCRFYTEKPTRIYNNEATSMPVQRFVNLTETESVYVYRINHLSVAQWVERFVYELERNAIIEY
tara:strand:- start:261 stop:533 length:273 start_codon:yes stop_codon:yes gene_type:complete